MHAIKIGRKKPKTLSIEMREIDSHRTKWIRICHEINSGRERKH